MRRMVVVLGWAWLMAGLAGCDRLLPAKEQEPGSPEEKASAACRKECGVAYKACLQDCKNDSPEACESRCDMKQRRCTDGCGAR